MNIYHCSNPDVPFKAPLPPNQAIPQKGRPMATLPRVPATPTLSAKLPVKINRYQCSQSFEEAAAVRSPLEPSWDNGSHFDQSGSFLQSMQQIQDPWESRPNVPEAAGMAASLKLPSYLACGNFISDFEQTIASPGDYTPVRLVPSSSLGFASDEENSSVIIQKDGVFFISYSILLTDHADKTATATLLAPKDCSAVPSTLLPFTRRLCSGNGYIMANGIASLAAGDRLFLGIRCSQPITLPASTSPCINAILTLYQIGSCNA